MPSRRNVRERESVSDTGKRNGLAQRPYASTSARTMKRFRCPSYSAGGERRFGHDDRARARACVCMYYQTPRRYFRTFFQFLCRPTDESALVRLSRHYYYCYCTYARCSTSNDDKYNPLRSVEARVRTYGKGHHDTEYAQRLSKIPGDVSVRTHGRPWRKLSVSS